MTDEREVEREAMALHLWDEGLVRPESLAFSVVDEFISEGWRRGPVEVTDVENDRQVAERAWDEGYGSDEECHTPRRNPYRKEQGNNND